MKSWLEQAREAAGLSPLECARILSMSEEAFLIRQKRPGILSLNELRALHGAFGEDARRIMWNALRDLQP